jgi:hypothetical protein
LLNRSVVALIAAAAGLVAGPVEFGMAELERAAAARGIRAPRVRTEVSADSPETYRIIGSLITGGDLRGLMYGLLEAADQVRETGRLAPVRGRPAVPIRGIRIFLHNAELEEDWYYSREYWQAFFAMLARNRYNRFNLVFAHQTDYLAPPYPFWVDVPEFSEVRVPGLTAERRQRNLEMLRFISETAADYAVDFTLGVWEHNIQPGMKPSVAGLTPENIGPYSHAALRKVLAACPAIRSVQMRTNSESGIPRERQVEFYRDWVFRAIRDAGRRVGLDLRGWLVAGGMVEAAQQAGIPVRLSTKYWAEHLGRPNQPAETWAGYSFLNFLEKPRSYDFFWELWGLGSHRLLLWGDPDYVRRAVRTFTLSGSVGFEIDPPLAQKGFGNRPGKWGVFADREREFWRWDFERYWMFYMLWGRLSFDPEARDRIWLSELERRFGKSAAPAVAEVYRAGSRVLNEIVTAHLADPNMYVWPEINPGGLLDAYVHVRPSDWRFVAAIPEAVRNRLGGIASAKQTPAETAELLRDAARRIDAARARAPAGNREWRGSEPDFEVLAHLARYHAHKQLAAEQAAYFDETGDRSALAGARREIEAAIQVWESLVRLTDGLYPAEMAYGPDDVGHWKDKLPYVRHDLKLVEERERVLEQFGPFETGFDFGGPLKAPRGASYRNDVYVLGNTAAPRFRVVDPATKFSEDTGYGWVVDGERRPHALPLTPYLEVRAVSRAPKHLPQNILYGDWIEGAGAQVFRTRVAGDGDYAVLRLTPDGTAVKQEVRAVNSYIDITFPEGEWNVAGLVVQRAGSQPDVRPYAAVKRPARPAISHVPVKTAAAGSRLRLSLKISPPSAASTVKLHYRALNQLSEFTVVEQSAARAEFTIPMTDRWDLMYYFEVLNKENSGWFEPDPLAATPYYVVAVTPASAGP